MNINNNVMLINIWLYTLNHLWNQPSFLRKQAFFLCLQVHLTGQVTTLWAQLAQHWLSTRLDHSLWSQLSNHSWRLCLRGTGTPPTALLSPSTRTSKTCVSFNSQYYWYHISLHQHKMLCHSYTFILALKLLCILYLSVETQPQTASQPLAKVQRGIVPSNQ